MIRLKLKANQQVKDASLAKAAAEEVRSTKNTLTLTPRRPKTIRPAELTSNSAATTTCHDQSATSTLKKQEVLNHVNVLSSRSTVKEKKSHGFMLL